MTRFAPLAAALTLAAASSALAQDPATTQGVRADQLTILDGTQRTRFRAFVASERRPSAELAQELQIGAVLPEKSVVFYAVPAHYGARGYRYAVVNHRTVLVHPATHQIVEIVH